MSSLMHCSCCFNHVMSPIMPTWLCPSICISIQSPQLHSYHHSLTSILISSLCLPPTVLTNSDSNRYSWGTMLPLSWLRFHHHTHRHITAHSPSLFTHITFPIHSRFSCWSCHLISLMPSHLYFYCYALLILPFRLYHYRYIIHHVAVLMLLLSSYHGLVIGI